jgi:hypothetical protein
MLNLPEGAAPGLTPQPGPWKREPELPGPPDVEGTPPPPPSSWRYKHEGPPRIFALAGVVVGFAAFIVPGIFALRSYRRWQDGARAEPTLAWSMAVIGIVAIPTVLLFMLFPVVGVFFAILALLLGLSLVGPRH